MKNKSIKYQTERITVSTGFSSVKEVAVRLDSSYKNLVGYTVHSVSQAAADKFSLGLVDKTGVLQDRTFQNEHIADTSVPMKYRYKELFAKSDGSQINVQVEPVKTLTSDLVIDVVFKLENEATNC